MLVREKLGKARGNHGLDEIEIIHVQKKSTPDNSNLQGNRKKCELSGVWAIKGKII